MNRKKGYAAILVCAMLPILIIIMGICIDIGDILYCEAKLMTATKLAAISASSNYINNKGSLEIVEDDGFTQACLSENYAGSRLVNFQIDGDKKNECTIVGSAEVKCYFLNIIGVSSKTIKQSYTITRNFD